MAMLMLAIAIGLWIGQRWAWWVSTFNYLQIGVGDILSVIAMALGIVLTDRAFTPQLSIALVQHAIRGTVTILLTCYMFRSQVFGYFSFKRLTRWRAFGILCGMFIVLALLAFGGAVAAILWQQSQRLPR
jgi:hypothetical protein